MGKATALLGGVLSLPLPGPLGHRLAHWEVEALALYFPLNWEIGVPRHVSPQPRGLSPC